MSPRWQLRMILAVLACAMALVSIGRIYTKAFMDNRFDNQTWGLDFYQFWYGGHFFWQGEEPYTSIQSYLKEPDTPTYFIDGYNTGSDPKLRRRWGVSIIPGAAPLFLVVAPFSLLSWLNASIAWSVFNAVLGIGFVWLLVKLNGGKMASVDGMFLLGLFFSTIAARQTIELGQTSLMIAVSMLGALLIAGSHPAIAGILLAIAVSKYTVGFPAFLYFFCRRWWRGLISCVVTHLLGILIIAAVGNASPLQVIRAYVLSSLLVLRQATDYSIHLLALGWGIVGYLLVGSITFAVIWALVIWYHKASSLIRKDMLTALTLVGIGSLWSLLSLYHGRQDMVVAFIFIAIIVQRVGRDRVRGLSNYRLTSMQAHLLYLITIFVFLAWSLPVYAFIGYTAYKWMYAICNIGVLAVLVLLLFKIQLPVIQPGALFPNGNENYAHCDQL